MYYSLQQYSELHCCRISGTLMPFFRSCFFKNQKMLSILRYDVALALVGCYGLGILIRSELPC